MPRKKNRRNRRSPPRIDPMPDPLIKNDSDNSSLPSSIADDYFSNLQNEADLDFLDLPFLCESPGISPRSTPRAKSPANSRSASSSSSVSPPPRKSKPQPRKLVLEDAMTAFSKFSQRNNAFTTHECSPTPDARRRLALHQSAELLGATSSSLGEGKGRFVVMKWPTGKKVPIKEAAFERGVIRILDELIPEKRERRRSGRELQRQLAKEARVSPMSDDEDGNTGSGSNRGTPPKLVGTNKKVGRGNVGFHMLEKMGWSEGTGLGAERDGRVDPIIGQRMARRAGLGSL